MKGLVCLCALLAIACTTPAPRLPPASQARVLLLGEIHDNPAGHQARHALLAAAIEQGWCPAIAMEQFDRDQQARLDQAQRDCRTADCLIEQTGRAGGWDWPLYRPLIQLALDHRLPLLAANLSRAEAGRATREGLKALFDADTRQRHGLTDTLPADIAAAQLEAILDGHCRMLPESVARTMVDAQVARDVGMAAALLDGLARQGAVVLIAGNGHVRRDVGVIRWLPAAVASDTQSHGFVEHGERGEPEQAFDTTHTVPAQTRPDPCEAVGKPS